MVGGITVISVNCVHQAEGAPLRRTQRLSTRAYVPAGAAALPLLIKLSLAIITRGIGESAAGPTTRGTEVHGDEPACSPVARDPVVQGAAGQRPSQVAEADAALARVHPSEKIALGEVGHAAVQGIGFVATSS